MVWVGHGMGVWVWRHGSCAELDGVYERMRRGEGYIMTGLHEHSW